MPYKDYEKQKENSRLNYYKNRERKLKQAKEYYLNNWDSKQEYRKMWREKNPEKVKEAVKKYNSSDKGKIAIAKGAQNWLDKNPEKLAAHYAVHNAVRRGALIKSAQCERCGLDGRIHGHHHKGYNKEYQLTVTWLCPRCHKETHNGKLV